MLRVTPQQSAQVVELWTGIPAAKIAESEFDKLSALPDELRSARRRARRRPSTPCVRALRRNRAGISAKRKPASFIFVGPTGVGKTELCKTLAGALFDTPETMIRLDMSEFMEKHSVSQPASARRRAMSATTRRASSPKRCAASPTASSSLTKSKRRTPTCSTSCCRFSTTAA